MKLGEEHMGLCTTFATFSKSKIRSDKKLYKFCSEEKEWVGNGWKEYEAEKINH